MSRRGLLAIISAVALLLASAPAGNASTAACTGMLGGGKQIMLIRGNLTVPEGASCTLDFVDVSGNIEVRAGGRLLISAYDEPSHIDGTISANKCDSVLLRGTIVVSGNLSVHDCVGNGTNGFQGPDTEIRGDFDCHNNAGPCDAWLGDVGGNIFVHDNSAKSPSDISLTLIGGTLTCRDDAIAPVDAHGPDWVSGNAAAGDAGGNTNLGPCAGFSTTSTSISAQVAPAASCGALASLAQAAFPVPNTVITSAADTPANDVLPERCIVDGFVNRHVSPVDNCTYQDLFQVQLPLADRWNHDFMFQGGGGTEGAVPTATGTNSGSGGASFGVTAGYAVASQNGGHQNSDLADPTCDGGDGDPLQFYLDPLAVIAQAYGSIEVTTLTAKFLITQYYGDGPSRSYWVGCSTGGRQGMVMSQHFPQFFDGVIAGDPVYDLQAISLAEVYGVQQIQDVYNTASPPLVPVVNVPGARAAATQSGPERGVLRARSGTVREGIAPGL